MCVGATTQGLELAGCELATDGLEIPEAAGSHKSAHSGGRENKGVTMKESVAAAWIFQLLEALIEIA